MTTGKYTMATLVIGIAIALSGYILLYEQIPKKFAVSHLERACVGESATVTKQNPNRMQFISCGGFL